MDAITTTDAGTIPAATTTEHPAPRRRRDFGAKADMSGKPIVRRFMVDGHEAVAVSLFGRLGEGLEMVMDAEDWPTAEAVTPRWTIATGRHEWAAVATGIVAGAHLAKQKGSVPLLLLHRLIMGAQPGDVVRFLSADKLDLRKSNLLKQTKRQASGRGATDAV